MSENIRPSRRPDFRLEKMDNELLLFNPTTTNVLYLNESASLIWQLCDGQRSSREIADLLTEAYPEAAPAIVKDVEDTLKLFLDHGAINLV